MSGRDPKAWWSQGVLHVPALFKPWPPGRQEDAQDRESRLVLVGHEYVAQFVRAEVARRAVACVNACEGLGTELLEGLLVQEVFQREEARADAAERQRDELLAALEKIEELAEPYQQYLRQVARDAIAKAKGGAA